MPYKLITGIYIIKNLKNNKVYIGSSKSVLKRISQHKNQLLKNKHSSIHLQSSFNKYGINNFTFNLLEKVELDKNLLREREEHYIKHFNSNNRLFGYNKRINCETNLGIKFSKEHIEKLRTSHLGHKRSKEAHKKIIESQYKKVYKVDDKNDIIQEYNSILEASIDNNIHKQSISACCRGKLNSTGGFYWCFLDDYDKNKKYKKISKIIKHKKFVYKNIITNEEFFKLKDVSEQTGLHSSALHRMFSGLNINKTNFIRYER